jgi:hypothetical protein
MDLSQKVDRPNFEPVKASVEVVAPSRNRIKNREEVSSTVFMGEFSDIKKKLPNFFLKKFSLEMCQFSIQKVPHFSNQSVTSCLLTGGPAAGAKP